MYVELQHVEEGVVDEIDRALDILLDAKQQLQRSTGLVAGPEWDIYQMTVLVCDVLARVSAVPKMLAMVRSPYCSATHSVLFRQLTGIGWPTLYAGVATS